MAGSGRDGASLGLGTLAAAVLCLLVEPAPALAKVSCPGGRFVVGGGPLLPGAPASQVDLIVLATAPAAPELSIGCGAADVKGVPKLKPGKRGAKVKVAWTDCGGLSGKVRLRGTIVDQCARLQATLAAKGIKKTFEAALSACGDGFVDTARGEVCETGGSCPGGAACAGDCSCASTTTTTETPTTTTTLPGVCNPLSPPGSQGCAAGNKCTWVRITDTPEPIGMIGCVPDGAQDVDQACAVGPPGETTGFDDCKAGLICVGGQCRDICGFDGSAAAACASDFHCTRYQDLFANGSDDPIAGACIASCNPLTQLRFDGSPCAAGEGCYLLSSATATIAVCAAAGSLAHGALITGPPFANSCLPGHMPRRRSPANSDSECGALCQVTDVYQGVNEASEGGVAPLTCESKGAAAPSDATNGESCRYWWAREPFETLSVFSNTVGWCFKHAAFQYDTNGDMTPDAPFPRCIDLTTGDLVPPIGNPPHNDALYFWCVALPASLQAGIAPPWAPPDLRLDRITAR